MSDKIVKAAPDEDEPESEEHDPDAPEDDKPMTFWEHIEELRKRIVWALGSLIVGCIVAWYFKEKILAAIVKPFSDSWRHQHVAGDPSLHFASPAAALVAYVKLAIIGGAALAAPFVFYQIWSFVAPGLYSKEKKYVLPFVTVSTLLFVGGGWFGYLAAFPFTFGYFLSLSGDVDAQKVVTIVPTVMMEDYIDFVMQMLFGFGIVFEIPILLTFLAMIGAVNHRMLIRFTRYYIFIAFVVAAVLTPPDWTSQLVMAIPACLLYFVSIGLVYVFQKKEFREDDEETKKAKAKKKADEEAKKIAESRKASSSRGTTPRSADTSDAPRKKVAAKRDVDESAPAGDRPKKKKKKKPTPEE